ncbi:MAG: hypothetical protein ABGZ17_29610 [Planctomycetaceae bacterium]
MFRIHRATLLFSAATLVFQLVPVVEGFGQRDASKAQANKSKSLVTISKETTFFTKPLTDSGFVDYSRAINERMGQGVTPQNNANVLFWQALGPAPSKTVMPAKFFQSLGIASPPKQGDYFLELTEYIEQRLRITHADAKYSQIIDHQGQASERPWKTGQFPQIMAWIQANEKPLALVVAGTKREKYFSPLAIADGQTGVAGTLISALLPAIQQARNFARALTARAMWHTGAGRNSEAWEDLLTVHRLGRLIGQGPTIIEALVGIAIDGMVTEADLAFVERTQPDARLARKYLADLAALPALPNMADKIDLTERCMFLDLTQMLTREGVADLGQLVGRGENVAGVLSKLATSVIDWNITMQTGNAWYDRLTGAMRIADRQQRKLAFAKIDQDLKSLSGKAKGITQGLRLLLATNKTRGKTMGEILVALLLPAAANAQQAEDRGLQRQANLRVAIALAGYRTQHGTYPESLKRLAPDMLKQIPTDLFAGKPLNYRRTSDGYLLYSIGPNEQDDGGRYYNDDPRGDDSRVRMPLPPVKD